MGFRVLLLTFVVMIGGCTTVEFVRRDTSPEKKGILRYSPTSSASKESKYRDKVSKEARGFCGGEYEITKEYQAREDTGTSTGVGTGMSVGMGGLMVGAAHRNDELYNFVEFRCL